MTSGDHFWGCINQCHAKQWMFTPQPCNIPVIQGSWTKKWKWGEIYGHTVIVTCMTEAQFYWLIWLIYLCLFWFSCNHLIGSIIYMLNFQINQHKLWQWSLLKFSTPKKGRWGRTKGQSRCRQIRKLPALPVMYKDKKEITWSLRESSWGMGEKD